MPSINFSVTSSRQQLPYPLPANTELTMSIGNPLSYASYAGLESTSNVSGFYTTLSPKSLSGSIISSSGLIDIIQDDYKMLAVVKPGGGSIVYKPSNYVSGSDLYMTGVGAGENYYFSFTIDTTAVASTGSTSGGTFKLPLSGSFPFTASVDWGDGTLSYISSSTQAEVTHVYPATASYLVRISGSLPNWSFRAPASGDMLKLRTINSWGGLQLGFPNMFYSCSNMVVLASDAPSFSSTSMMFMFRDCHLFNGYVNNWDVSRVTSFRSCFNSCSIFNQPMDKWDVGSITLFQFMFANNHPAIFNQDIGMWNVSNGTNFSTMFQEQRLFNQDLSRWNVSKATSMNYMFFNCSAFDKPLNTWNVNNVTTMAAMFGVDLGEGFGTFNQPLSNWNVSKVTDFSSMFQVQRRFNQDISMWNVSGGLNFSYMFAAAPEFTGSIGSWNMSNATNLEAMFFGASKFNSDISKWNTAKVTNMSWMFSTYWAGVSTVSSSFPTTVIFNQPLATSGSSWNVSKVTTFKGMFASNSFFNQDISNWNVSGAVTMSGMFYSASSFNQNIGSWNVSSSVLMDSMFAGATSFNQNLGSWNVRNVTDMSLMFEGVTLSTANYDALLIGWNSLPSLKLNVNFHGGYSKYSPAASASRSNLISTYGWTIIDGGPA